MKAHRGASLLIIVLAALLAMAGCRSRVIKVNLINTSNEPVKTIIVDYPSATFGKDKLAPGETFSYAIKPLETGQLKVRFTGADGREHSYTGPMLGKDDEGEIDISFARNEVTANIRFMRK
jgi:hypothetical protein